MRAVAGRAAEFELNCRFQSLFMHLLLNVLFVFSMCSIFVATTFPFSLLLSSIKLKCFFNVYVCVYVCLCVKAVRDVRLKRFHNSNKI